MINERRVRLEVAAGVTLDGRLAMPEAATAGVVLCHPHPLYGGDMENPVVIRAAEVCQEAGLATLRFDFRGVGASTGTHDEGRGERDDLLTALSTLGAELPAPARLAAVGYSFGAAITARVAATTPLSGVALIAPPVGIRGLDQFGDLAQFAGPLLVVAGTADQYCPPEALARLGQTLPKATVRSVEGADHFFHGKLYPLGVILAEWARPLATASA